MVKKKILVTGANGLLGQKIIYNLKISTDVSLLACSKGVNRLIETNGYI
jgi:dTDP-4-dehydrorhamnose reductase